MGDRDKYLELYEEYKETQIQKSATGNHKYTAIVTSEIKDLLKNYNSIDL